MSNARDRLLNVVDEAALAIYVAEALNAAADRVAALPTANEGQLIHATREQILNTIRSAAS